MSEKQPNTIQSFSQKIKFNPEKNEYMIFRKTRIWNYDKLNQRKYGKNPIEVKEEWLPLSVLGVIEPKKEVEIDIIILKNAVDTYTLEPLQAYFKQKLKIKVLGDAVYKYQYLVKSMNRAYINNIKSGQCTPIAMTGSQEGIAKEFLGLEQKITEAEAQKLIADNVAVYQKSGEGMRLVI